MPLAPSVTEITDKKTRVSTAACLYVKHSVLQADSLDYPHVHLLQVTPETTGKKNSEGCEGLPSLSGASLAAWYRIALEELQVCSVVIFTIAKA